MLRETISFLRTYATYGYLDGQVTGMELLQSTIDALQKEQTTVQSAIVNSTDIILRRKIMELNLWLLTAFVLDFITLPPAQPSGGRESMGRGSLFSPADILSGMPDFSHFTVSPTPSPAKREVTGRGNRASGTWNAVDISSEMSRNRVRSVDFTSPHEKSLSEISASDLSDVSSDQPLLLSLQHVRIDTAPHVAPRLFSPDANISRMEKGRKERRSTAFKSSKHNGKKWKLVESLLNLLGPMNSNTWQSIDRVERFKAAIKVGYRLGRFAMNIVEESVNQIIPQSAVTPLTPLKNSSLPSANRNKDALVLRAIDGTFWIILRVLLDLFIQTPFADRDMHDGAVQPVAMKALARLMTLLEWAKEISREFYDTESLFIVIKLSEVLHAGKQPIYSAWSKEALQTITMLLSLQRGKIRDKVSVLGGGVGINKAPSGDHTPDQLMLERPSLLGDRPNEDDIMSARSSFSSRSEASTSDNRRSIDGSAPLKTTGSFDELDKVGDAAEIVVNAINQSLKLHDEHALTWSKWNEITEPIMREALRAEKDMLSTKLNVMGLHKDSAESTRQLEDARRAEELQLTGLSHRMDDLDVKIKMLESKHSRELMRSEDTRRKRCRANWGVVYEELANERGPWGGGALDSSDVRTFFLSFLFKL